jgi:hypothetical protein
MGKKKLGMVGHACHPAMAGRIRVQAGLCKKGDPISKITRAEWVGAVAQAVECLSRKHEALSSNSSTAKKKIQHIKFVLYIYNSA